MIYLVDYENVNLSGMIGIENLEEKDHVVVFLGNNTGAIPFEWHIRIMDSKAQVKYIKCGKVSKNYLDFQLATFCGYIMAGLEHEKIYVVSKDKGFDSIVDFWTENKEDVQIARIEAIDESLDIPRPMNKQKERSAKPKKQNNKKNNKKGRNRQEEKVIEESLEMLQRMSAEEASVPIEVEDVAVEAEVQMQPEEAPIESEEQIQPEEVTIEEAVQVQPEEVPVEETVQAQPEEVAVEEAEQVQSEEAAVEEAEQVQSEEVAVEEVEPAQVEEVAVEEAEQAQPEAIAVEAAEQAQPEESVVGAEVPKRVSRTRKRREKEVQPEKINKLSETTKKHIRQKIKDEQLNGGNYKTIYNIFMTQSAKNRFNTALVKAFQQEQGNRIYKKLLSEFESHVKSQE